jgi:hypothetical protein
VFFSGQVTPSSVAGGLGQLQTSSTQVAEVCIIGDGAAERLALANLVGAHKVAIFADGIVSPYPNLEQLQVREYEVRERGAAVCSQRGSTRIDVKNVDRVDDLRNADGIIIDAPTTRYGAIVEKLSQSFRDHQTIVLINASLGAGLEFRSLLGKYKVKQQINVIETGRLFDSARVESGVLLISGLRNKVGVCGLERNETRRGLPVATAVVKEIVPFSSVLERGLTDAERVVRPAILLSALIADDMELSVNASVVKILQALDREVQGIAKSFQCVVPGFTRNLQDFASNESGVGRSKSATLEGALSALGVGLFAGTEATRETYINMLIEDVCESLTLLSDMGVLSHSPVGVISSIVEMASVVVGEDLNKRGRKLSSLGLIGFDTEEIIEIVNA